MVHPSHLIGIITFLSLSLLAEEPPFHLSLLWRFNAKQICPIDINGDGKDELIVRRDKPIDIRDQSLNILWQIHFEEGAPPIANSSLSRDIPYILLSSVYKDTLLLEVMDSAGNLLYNYKLLEVKDRAPPEGWDGGVNVIGRFNDEYLFKISCGYDLKPRGFFSLNIKTGKIGWFYEIAPIPYPIPPVDITGDGEPEVISGSSPPCNGDRVGNTDDAHFYLYVWDKNGKLLWMKEEGIGFGDIFAGVILESREVVAFRRSAGKTPGSDFVAIYDGATGKEKRRRELEGKGEGKLVIADINNDNKKEIIIGTSQGQLLVLNQELNIIDSLTYSAGIGAEGAWNLTADPTPEIVTQTKDGKILVFDNTLRLLASYQFKGGEPTTYIIPVRYGKRERLLIIPPNKNQFILTELRPASILPIATTLPHWTYPLLIGLLLSFLVFLFLYLDSQNQKNLLFSISNNGLILCRNGKILKRNRRAEELLKYPEIEKEVVEFCKIEEREKRLTLNLSGELKDFLLTKERAGRKYLIKIEDKTQEMAVKYILSWIPMAQELAHSIKNPISNIRLATQHLKGTKKSTYLDIIEGESERLLKFTDGFMKFTSLGALRLEKTDINRFISELVKKYEEVLTKGKGIEFKPQEEIPEVNIDRRQMELALSNIINNGFEAIRGKGEVRIATASKERIREGKVCPYIEVVITDTGQGMDKKTIEKIFKPFYSTKRGGTGMGLVLAKRIIESHKGEIRIESKKGLGTSVTITLPIEE